MKGKIGMNGLRNSIFNKTLNLFEKNRITKEMIYFVIKIGLGDFVYRLIRHYSLYEAQTVMYAII